MTTIRLTSRYRQLRCNLAHKLVQESYNRTSNDELVLNVIGSQLARNHGIGLKSRDAMKQLIVRFFFHFSPWPLILARDLLWNMREN